MRRLLLTTAILSLAGVVVSSYALVQHFSPLGSGFCNVSARISCDLVNKSAYSEFFGIPISLIGILGYTLLEALAVAALVLRPPQATAILPWLLAASIGGLGFSLYLTYIELFVIGAICILCVTSQVLILGITTLSAIAWKRQSPVAS